jgi:cytochrome o ubiquinol oxidase subunit III
MSAADATLDAGRGQRDPYHVGHGRPRHGASHAHGHGAHGHAVGHGDGGPASKRIVVGYGFWIFLLSDIVMFAAFFAAYAVLATAIADGPSGAQLFDLRLTAVQTSALLLSSFTCGLASLAVDARRALWFYAAMGATFLLGAAFLALEAYEFSELIARAAGPSRSAFLSSFFTLVGCHGLHVLAGLLWLLTMMAQIFAKGFRDDIIRRFMCFSLFWHALDIVWVAVFTVVYLLGSGL